MFRSSPFFVAVRDLRHARGRFMLMTVVLVLVAFLVTFLAVLTAGLGRASTSAVTGLPADRLAFSQPVGSTLAFTDSQVKQAQWTDWSRRDGVSRAEPLGIATVRATTEGAASDGAGPDGATAAVTAFGVAPGSQLVPDGDGDGVRGGSNSARSGVSGSRDDVTIVLSSGAADALQAATGDHVTVQGVEATVSAVTGTASDFAHTPVVWLPLDAWQSFGAHGRSDAPVATVVALWDAPGASHTDPSAGDTALGTRSVTPSDARSAVASYAAEHLSLTVMQAFLLAISALVVGAFFTVWTIQRAGDLAVLKALGASSGFLVRDALGQALAVLVVGVGLGAGLASAAATLAGAAIPIAPSPATTVLPGVLLVLLGAVGAAAAVARIARVDPHAALSAR